MPTLFLNQNQTKTASAAPKDDNENPGLINGVPTWHSVEPSLTITPATDGLSATIKAGTVPGTFSVDVSVQAQPSGPLITSSFPVTVQNALATHFTFAFS